MRLRRSIDDDPDDFCAQALGRCARRPQGKDCCVRPGLAVTVMIVGQAAVVIETAGDNVQFFAERTLHKKIKMQSAKCKVNEIAPSTLQASSRPQAGGELAEVERSLQSRFLHFAHPYWGSLRSK